MVKLTPAPEPFAVPDSEYDPTEAKPVVDGWAKVDSGVVSMREIRAALNIETGRIKKSQAVPAEDWSNDCTCGADNKRGLHQKGCAKVAGSAETK